MNKKRTQAERERDNVLEDQIIDVLGVTGPLDRGEVYRRVRGDQHISTAFDRVLNRLRRAGIVQTKGRAPEQAVSLRDEWR